LMKIRADAEWARAASKKGLTITPRRASAGTQSARNRIAPTRPFAVARRIVHARLEAPLALPAGGKTGKVRAQTRRQAGEIGAAERGRSHHRRPIAGPAKYAGHELQGDVASRHAAVDAQHRIAVGGRPVRAHGLEQVARLVADRLERGARELGHARI